MKCYVMYTCTDNKAIAFLYIYNEDKASNIVSIHGGGWGKSFHLSLLYYRGLILMIQYLWQQGFRVRTSCMVENKRAYRFLQSVGFVIYRSTDTYIYMWINEKRLKGNRMYKHLYTEC